MHLFSFAFFPVFALPIFLPTYALAVGPGIPQFAPQKPAPTAAPTLAPLPTSTPTPFPPTPTPPPAQPTPPPTVAPTPVAPTPAATPLAPPAPTPAAALLSQPPDLGFAPFGEWVSWGRSVPKAQHGLQSRGLVGPQGGLRLHWGREPTWAQLELRVGALYRVESDKTPKDRDNSDGPQSALDPSLALHVDTHPFARSQVQLSGHWNTPKSPSGGRSTGGDALRSIEGRGVLGAFDATWQQHLVVTSGWSLQTGLGVTWQIPVNTIYALRDPSIGGTCQKVKNPSVYTHSVVEKGDCAHYRNARGDKTFELRSVDETGEWAAMLWKGAGLWVGLSKNIGTRHSLNGELSWHETQITTKENEGFYPGTPRSDLSSDFDSGDLQDLEADGLLQKAAIIHAPRKSFAGLQLWWNSAWTPSWQTRLGLDFGGLPLSETTRHSSDSWAPNTLGLRLQVSWSPPAK